MGSAWGGCSIYPYTCTGFTAQGGFNVASAGVEQLLAVEAELEALTYRLETSPMFAGANGLAAQEANRVLRSLGAAIRTITTATSSREEA